MQQLTQDIATLLLLAAVFGVLNYHVLKLPRTIGLVVVALVASIVVLAIDRLVPGWGVGPGLKAALRDIDFADTLMEGMLSFLLFAGALHVDIGDLARRKWAITAMATGGLLLSTCMVGTAMWLVFDLLGLPVAYLYCLIFGALISPTDPVAVLGILKSANVPRSLEAKIAGESLFNDGVGVVVFIILVGLAAGGADGAGLDAGDIALLFVQEAVGGAVLGLLAGYLAFLALKTVDEFNLEIIITLALVTGAYEVAQLLHMSGPIAVVVAGLMIGNHGTRLAMSKKTRNHLEIFWTVVDEILNAVLFLLIGLEVLVLTIQLPVAIAAIAAIPIVLAARFIAVGIPIRLLALRDEFTPGAVRILTWGGLRGGISVALVLSLPGSAEKDLLLTVCYAVVVFSIIVQGLTVGHLVKRLIPPQDHPGGH